MKNKSFVDDNEPCLICGRKDHYAVIEKPQRIVQCKNCRFIFRSSRPSQDELRSYYSFSDSRTHHVDQKLRERQTMRRIDILSKMVNIDKVRSLIDIGCDDGLFLYMMKRKNPNIEVFGVEPSGERVKSGRALYGLTNITMSTIERVLFERTFDLITGFHVLEHVYNPREFLEKIKSAMTSNSFLCLEVPTISLSRLDLPFNMRLLAPGYTNSPEHLWFFTKKTLTDLLKVCDFRIRTVKCTSFGIHPILNSWIMKQIPQLFPWYQYVSEAVLLPFNSLGRGLQVMALVRK